MLVRGARLVKGAARALSYLWAAPNTALGLLAGAAARLAGARACWREGVLEIWGGALGRVAATRTSFCAITLGHVVLAVDEATLARVREHERVHVRQCERWGPLFLPAYAISSVLQLLRGGRPYRDNHFEREAYAHEAALLASRGRHPPPG
jgi:hypothetical protein